MMALLLIFIKLPVYIIINLQFGQALDTMLPSQSISVGQNLISANQKFELGFFSPINSSRAYIGIWFKAIPDTILWVANRENPLHVLDKSARFMLSNDGNLKIVDSNQSTVWSTNISVGLSNSFAVLSDTGDLILKDSKSGWVSWESFAYPCDVFMMHMQLVINTKSGERQYLSSWRSEVDPTVGDFTTGLLPQSPVQAFLWKGEAMYWRSGPWNGFKFVGTSFKIDGYMDSWSIRQNHDTETIYMSANQHDTYTISIVKLFPDGSLKKMHWVGNNWKVLWEGPEYPCDVYGICGPFGVCNANGSPICSCPRGFIPKSAERWNEGNWSDGCIRGIELRFSKNKIKNDGFWKLSRMKVADSYQYLPSVGSQGCQERCLNNCSCTAYAYIAGIGCLVWTRDLIDMQEFQDSGEDLFIRLDHSELVESKKVIIIISLVSSLFIIILCFLITVVLHKVGNKQHREWRKGILKHFLLASSSDVQQVLSRKNFFEDELTTFDYKDIVTATNGFSNSNKIGQGGFGAVFRGKLHDGKQIAVKRLSGHSRQGINEFSNEVLLISRLLHRNLVKILGCSIEGDENLIVYEYLPNGSLDAFLFDSSKKNKLDWATRFNIIQGIARGLSYLHRDSRLKVIHRDLKGSNVLLDDDMNPKISDFGLARTFLATQESENTCRVVGTYGYMSPEYALRGVFSEKSDIFSFGVLLLEIVSGKKISRFDNNNETLGLLSYAWKLWNEVRELELMDDALVNFDSDQVIRCIRVELVCVQDRADDRPTMTTVILMLSSDMQLPQPKKPLFFPEIPSYVHVEMDSANEVTESHVQGR